MRNSKSNLLISLLLISGLNLLVSPFPIAMDPPVITTLPGNLRFESSQIYNHLIWIVEDHDPNDFYLTVDGSLVSNGSWISHQPIQFDFDGYEVGIYQIRLELYDLADHKTVSIIWVTVVDTTPPTINRPSDIAISFNSLLNAIRWIPADAHPSVYEITVNGEFYQQGEWITAVSIYITVNHLKIGLYDFVIFIWDLYGNLVIDEVLVDIFDWPPQTPSLT